LPAASFVPTQRWRTPYVALLCAGTSALISRKIRSHSTRKLSLDRPLGESEAIALAEELNADLLIIDERLGTKIAKDRGLETIGLLGLLIRAKEKSIVKTLRPVLEELEINGFWMGDKLKKRILELVNE